MEAFKAVPNHPPHMTPNAELPQRGSTLAKDLPAGLVVFLVALPLCLGISLASGAPLLSGLIAGIVGGLVVSWVSGSSLSVSGPAAGLTTIVLAGIQKMGSYEAFLVAVVMAGILQLGLGMLKAGVIGMYFPTSVIRGMLAAIGIILLMKQIPHFLGGQEDFFKDLDLFESEFIGALDKIQRAAAKLQPGAMLIGFVSLSILLLWEQPFVKKVKALNLLPGALLVVLSAIGINELLAVVRPEWQVQTAHLVNLPQIGSVSDLSKVLRFPDWSVLTKGPAVYVLAATIAAVASLESLLSVEAVDKLDPQKRRTPTSRELLAQGAGNTLSGLIGGLPLTAVIVRSSANLNAGAQSRLSAFIHGIMLLMAVLFLEDVLNLIPLSALAAVLLLVGFKLTKPALYSSQWRLGWAQFMPFVVTVVAILASDLLKGVGVGLAVAAFFILKANADSALFFHYEPDHNPGTVHLKLSEHVTFLNKAAITTTLDRFQPGTHVILDGSESVTIDYDVLEAIENFRQSAADRGVTLELRDIPQIQLVGH